MIRNIVPALEACPPRTPLLINDMIMPKHGEAGKFKERSLRQLDMGMLVVLGAKQRSEKDFRQLIQAVDPRLEVGNNFF